jgi:hypothetical protein
MADAGIPSLISIPPLLTFQGEKNMSFMTNTTTTTNGALAHITSGNPLVDLFYKIGASREQDLSELFLQAFNYDPTTCGRILFWARDVREGAGERDTFRKLFSILPEETKDYLMFHIPFYGRWDDILEVGCDVVAHILISEALRTHNDGLCAKWMPRKGEKANKLRDALGLSNKEYRVLLSSLSSTVEQQMCANKWEDINFSHVPSVASKAYQKAFQKHQEARYKEWQAGLITGETKVNASAIFPHDVIVGMKNGSPETAEAQWKALPDYMVPGKKILPMVDVSGSMTCSAPGTNVTCLDISIALGLYISERNVGPFQYEMVTFETEPSIERITGTLKQRVKETEKLSWGGSTNLAKALDIIVDAAERINIKQDDMPEILLVLSDMQFDKTMLDETSLQMVQRKFESAGYKVPGIVFWNLNSKDNMPALDKATGVAMVSGFSPSILKVITSCDMENFTPLGVMKLTVNSERYTRIQL